MSNDTRVEQMQHENMAYIDTKKGQLARILSEKWTDQQKEQELQILYNQLMVDRNNKSRLFTSEQKQELDNIIEEARVQRELILKNAKNQMQKIRNEVNEQWTSAFPDNANTRNATPAIVAGAPAMPPEKADPKVTKAATNELYREAKKDFNEKISGNRIDTFKSGISFLNSVALLSFSEKDLPNIDEKEREILAQNMPAVRAIAGAVMVDTLLESYKVSFDRAGKIHLNMLPNLKKNDANQVEQIINVEIERNPDFSQMLRSGLLYRDGDLSQYRKVVSDVNGENIPENKQNMHAFLDYLEAKKADNSLSQSGAIMLANRSSMDGVDFSSHLASVPFVAEMWRAAQDPQVQKAVEEGTKQLQNKVQSNAKSEWNYSPSFEAGDYLRAMGKDWDEMKVGENGIQKWLDMMVKAGGFMMQSTVDVIGSMKKLTPMQAALVGLGILGSICKLGVWNTLGTIVGLSSAYKMYEYGTGEGRVTQAALNEGTAASHHISVEQASEINKNLAPLNNEKYSEVIKSVNNQKTTLSSEKQQIVKQNQDFIRDTSVLVDKYFDSDPTVAQNPELLKTVKENASFGDLKAIAEAKDDSIRKALIIQLLEKYKPKNAQEKSMIDELLQALRSWDGKDFAIVVASVVIAITVLWVFGAWKIIKAPFWLIAKTWKLTKWTWEKLGILNKISKSAEGEKVTLIEWLKGLINSDQKFDNKIKDLAKILNENKPMNMKKANELVRNHNAMIDKVLEKRPERVELNELKIATIPGASLAKARIQISDKGLELLKQISGFKLKNVSTFKSNMSGEAKVFEDANTKTDGAQEYAGAAQKATETGGVKNFSEANASNAIRDITLSDGSVINIKDAHIQELQGMSEEIKKSGISEKIRWKLRENMNKIMKQYEKIFKGVEINQTGEISILEKVSPSVWEFLQKIFPHAVKK